MAKAQSNSQGPARANNSAAVRTAGRRRQGKAASAAGGEEEKIPDLDIAAGLNYNEARTALDLSLAELQSSDLPIETMAELYQRAQAYATRCDQLLTQVEQDVLLWTGDDPSAPPIAYIP